MRQRDFDFWDEIVVGVLVIITLIAFAVTSHAQEIKRRPVEPYDNKAYNQQMSRWVSDAKMRVDFELKAMNPNVDLSRVQYGYQEDIEIKRVKDGKAKIIAYRYSSVVYNNEGRRTTIIRAQKGKLKHAWELKDGEYWGMHQYDFKVHRATVEVKEIEGEQ